MGWKDRAEQATLFLDQGNRQRLIPLCECAVAHHVGEHNRRELAMASDVNRHLQLSGPTGLIETSFRIAQIGSALSNRLRVGPTDKAVLIWSMSAAASRASASLPSI